MIKARTIPMLLGLLLGVAAHAAESAAIAAACPSVRSPVPEAQRKFHPGHYVAIGRGEARKGFEKALQQALTKDVAGVLLRYRWVELEPEEGRYDFSAIERDLATLTRLDKQLVVLVADKSFDYELPTPPYLHEKYTPGSRNRGYTAVRWDPYVNDRMKKLVAKLGAQFDCRPNVEGIGFQESALSLEDDVLRAHGYTPEKYRDAIISLLNTAAQSFPRSRVFWSMNFLPERQEYIGDIADAVIGKGVVMGGPDVLPENPALTRRVYPFYDRYQGRLKLFGSMQHNSYRHPRSSSNGSAREYWSMEDLFEFARDELHVDYVFWEYRSRRQPADARDWSEARAVMAHHPTF